jgi:hypothetical protein
MSLNPFSTVSDYPSMLNKIAVYTFFVSLAMAGLIYWQVPDFRALVPDWHVKIPETDAKVPGFLLIIALVFAFLSRVLKLHDRLSDLFRIRHQFDIYSILLPMASAAGVALTLAQQNAVAQKRHELMSKVFYKFASSSPGSAVVDQHAITMAIDQWSWYWILEEAAFVLFVSAVLSLLLGKSTLPAVLFLFGFGLIWIMTFVHRGCKRYAQDEITQILDGPDRRATVAECFRAL